MYLLKVLFHIRQSVKTLDTKQLSSKQLIKIPATIYQNTFILWTVRRGI